jgi:thiamine-monophosphate kinase
VRSLGRPPAWVRVGPGDDAAVLAVADRSLLVTTDALVDGVHFRRGWLSPRALGERAYRVNASDVAAMGGWPRAAVMALEVPRGTPTAILDGIVAGFVRAARAHGAVLVGGNLARGPRLAITVTLLGRPGRRIVTRGGARPGDVVFVTGALGAGAAAVRARRGGRTAAFPAVPDRVAVGAALAGIASAMIDVSDGLLQDLGHVARASGVAIRVAADRIPLAAACRRLPRREGLTLAVAGGEDYELAGTVPRGRRAALQRIARRLGCPCTEIGEVVAGRPAVRLLDASGRALHVARAGFDHLRR